MVPASITLVISGHPVITGCDSRLGQIKDVNISIGLHFLDTRVSGESGGLRLSCDYAVIVKYRPQETYVDVYVTKTTLYQ